MTSIREVPLDVVTAPSTPGSRRVGVWLRVLIGCVLVAVIAVAPIVVNGYVLSLLIAILIAIFPIVGLTMLVGFAGQVSMSQAAFAGVGAYMYANLTVMHHWSPFLAMTLAIAVVFVVSLLLAYPILKLKGYYLAMATLGLGLIASSAFSSLSSLTGGFSGISGIPTLSAFGFSIDSPERLYYYAVALALIVLILAHNLTTGDFGRRLRTIRESELLARAYGIDVRVMKAQVFAIASALAALSGIVYAQYVTFVSPETFSITQSITYLLGAVIGGLGGMVGAVLGSAYVVLLPHILEAAQFWTTAISGFITLVVIVVLPGGLSDIWSVRSLPVGALRRSVSRGAKRGRRG